MKKRERKKVNNLRERNICKLEERKIKEQRVLQKEK